ncbi:MAG: hypothetical protein DKM50_06520 [Candidatus Margulisiibacteriota bacterium]|nr:MAG: hypothetical protein A2X43_00490 [Candidatus Margulisbacteria bacterium GWD2_39_127]OGI04297.1 MAG: hypothetical protein A2X42_05185 [Candidatus Margulisbacteria bacterium GWF2_38_17]OGI11798.1 MAG: hypothetical protein A2X41_11065 [Candidatus Margulisbacteria bacterium GWE2_39_32]PZM79831.1 MAG: hypothetical protein DKM50_06520 [Candidatus Margulisiibacteriota bacterium]HAR62740.1 hypothetical protein [Candidatus Margulisiibacteriota bacterium]
MDISGPANEYFLNPTLGNTNAGFTGLSNDQVFFNSSLKNKPLDPAKMNEAVEKNAVNYWDMKANNVTYNQSGLLLSQNPVSSLQPSFNLSDQNDLLGQQVNYNAMSTRFLEKYYDIGKSSEQDKNIDKSA